MSSNLPPGCSDADLDRWYNLDEDYEEEPEDPPAPEDCLP
jgi:hypothetical protein